MWLAIVGSRTFGDCPCRGLSKDPDHPSRCPTILSRQLVLNTIVRWAQKEGFEGIVSGGAPGADSIAEQMADLVDVETKIYRPKAGPEPFAVRAHARNQQIVDRSDTLIAFFSPGPKSPGTSDSVSRAHRKGIPVWIWQEGRWALEP